MPVLPHPSSPQCYLSGLLAFPPLPGAGQAHWCLASPNSDPTCDGTACSASIMLTPTQNAAILPARQPASLTVILSSASLLSLFPTQFPHSSQTVLLPPASFAQKFQGLPSSEGKVQPYCSLRGGQVSSAACLSSSFTPSFCLSCSHTGPLLVFTCTIRLPPGPLHMLFPLPGVLFHQIHAQFLLLTYSTWQILGT